MKKFALLILLPVLFWGCEKTNDSIINSDFGNTFQVSSVDSYDSFYYAPDDSLLPVSITFKSISGIKNIYFDIYNSANTRLNSSPVKLYDNGKAENGDETAGDKTYSNLFPLSTSYPVGFYKINYFVENSYAHIVKVAEHNFIYHNGQDNAAPVVSDLVAPDSVQLTQSNVYLTLYITASDSNGLSDILSVFFNSFIPPDYHPSQQNPIEMFDDGDSVHGDQFAGDGIYSQIVVLPPGVTTGIYRWEFQAKDRSHALSDKIIHNIKVY